jgi:hypothetical protein
MQTLGWFDIGVTYMHSDINFLESYAMEKACLTPGIQYGSVGGVTLCPMPYLTDLYQCEERILVQTHITTTVTRACANMLCCSAASVDK